MTRAIFEPHRVADRIHKQAITGGQLRFALQHAKELDERVNSLGFVTVKAGKDPEPDRIVASLRTDEQVPRQFVSLVAALELRAVVGDEVGRIRRNLIERSEQLGN